MKRIFTLLYITQILLLSSHFAFSRQNEIDSLRNLLEISKEDTVKLEIWSQLGRRVAQNDPNETLDIAQKMLLLSQKLNYSKGFSMAYHTRGNAHQSLANYDSALYYFLKSLAVKERIGDKKGISASLNNIGVLYEDFFNDHEKALDYHTRSIKIKEEMGNRRGLGSSYDNVGIVYMNMAKDTLQANPEKALELFKISLDYLKQSLDIVKEFNDKPGMVGLYNDIGDNYRLRREYGAALEYYRQAFELAEVLDIMHPRAQTHYNMGNTFMLQGRHKEAAKYLNKALELATQANAKDLLQKSHLSLSENYDKLKQPVLALEHYKKGMAFKDLIYKEDNNRQIAYLRMTFNTKKQQEDIKNLNKKNEAEAMLRNFMIGGFVLVFGFIVAIYRTNQRMRHYNRTLLVKNNEINQQNEEIMAQRDNLEEKTMRLLQANEEILKQKEEIESQRDNIEQQKDQIAEALHDIKLLSKIGQELTASLDFETTFVRLYQYVINLMQADCFRVMIHNEEKRVLEDTYCIDRGTRKPSEAISLDEDARLSVICTRNNEAIFISNYLEEYKKYTPQLNITSSEGIPLSIIYLPLAIEDKVVGVISVQSFQKEAYNEYELNVLKTLAAYAAIALDNANAYKHISAQNEIIAEKNKSITDSLRYAETMQKAMLPPEDLFKKLFAEHFILYMPRDIVSGDFYWCATVEDKTFVAVVDCTGHGVPGAFMSLIGISLLNDIVKQRHIYSPAQILEELHKGVQAALKQENKTNDDGMDVCLCRLEKVPYDNTKVTFAGAKRPLLYKTHNAVQLNRIKGDNKPIGGWHKANTSCFQDHEIILNSGDVLYLLTDGLADQDNEQRDKFGMEKLTTLLESYAYLNLTEQKQEIMHELITYRRGRPQRDDISMMALRL